MGALPAEQMQCMEVWGGSQLTSRRVVFGGLDAWVYSKPYGEAEHGGDVYYASSCATGRISRLLLADVAGHGAKVASVAADLRSLMRQFVNRLDQAEFVRLLNQEFTELSAMGSFATAVVATFFEPSRRMLLCNAGHPSPILYRAATKEWSALGQVGSGGGGPRNLPLGLMSITEYEHFDVQLEPGDCLVAYTDALMESTDENGEMLGEDGVLRILRTFDDMAPDQWTDALLSEITRRYPESLAADDVTVLVVRATGEALQYPVADKVHAAGRMAAAWVRSFGPNAEPAPFPDLSLPNMAGALIPALARRWRAKT
jgi:sigma-B regulation protein RsbU (phosphoserine phosphatase)